MASSSSSSTGARNFGAFVWSNIRKRPLLFNGLSGGISCAISDAFAQEYEHRYYHDCGSDDDDNGTDDDSSNNSDSNGNFHNDDSSSNRGNDRHINHNNDMGHNDNNTKYKQHQQQQQQRERRHQEIDDVSSRSHHLTGLATIHRKDWRKERQKLQSGIQRYHSNPAQYTYLIPSISSSSWSSSCSPSSIIDTGAITTARTTPDMIPTVLQNNVPAPVYHNTTSESSDSMTLTTTTTNNNKKKDEKKTIETTTLVEREWVFDWVRFGAAGVLGFFLGGVVYPTAYAKLDSVWNGTSFKMVLKKAVTEIFTVGIFVNSLSMTYRGIFRGDHPPIDVIRHVVDEIPTVTRNDLLIWLPYNVVAFGMIPAFIRPATTTLLEAAWQMYISLRSHDFDDDGRHKP